MKTISFIVPCYNSAEYMDTCISSILAGADQRDDIEIIIVDDGSQKDTTPQKADEWAKAHPTCVRVIHQENSGHGGAINSGLKAARGLYFKVVDSDDWLDEAALKHTLGYLRTQKDREKPTDLVIANYVYEKVFEKTRTAIDYKNVFPEEREFGWDECGHFKTSQYLLMHSVIYRTELLRESGLVLPKHCFYVDNIFVYSPLPYVKTLYYQNVDLYRYFIGREGQSVNEEVMMKRIDQQLKVTRIMIDDSVLEEKMPSKKLIRYRENYLSMMMCICSVFLRMIDTPAANAKREELWHYLKQKNPQTYAPIRYNILNIVVNLPGKVGKGIGLFFYHLAQKIFKFN